MPRESFHIEPSGATATARHYIRDLVYGANDGLGAVFGIARGVVLVLVFVLFAGLTALPRMNWWQNSALAPMLATGAMALAPWLPSEWAQRLDYSREGRTLPRAPAERKV